MSIFYFVTTHHNLNVGMLALLFGVILPSDVSCQIMGSCIGTVTKGAVIHVGRAPKYETRNLLVKTFHLIYYMTTFLKL